MKPRSVALALIAAALGLVACRNHGAAADAPKPVTHTVTIQAMRFEPERLAIKAGDTVVWINTDLVPHTATAQGGGFNSASIDAGKSWQFTPAAPGTVDYVCSFHPSMKATLAVKEEQ